MSIEIILKSRVLFYKKILAEAVVDNDLEIVQKLVVNIETISDLIYILLSKNELDKKYISLDFLEGLVQNLNCLMSLTKNSKIKENILFSRNEIARLILKIRE